MEMQQMIQLLLEMKADRKTDQEQMMTKLDEKLDAYQEKAAADRKADKEEMKAAMRSMRSELDEAIQQTIDGIKARTDAMRMKIGSSHRESTGVIEPETEELETMACQGMEARPEVEKPASLDKKPEAAEEYKAPVENATVIPVGEPKKKQRRDRQLAAKHRRQITETSIREKCGPQTGLTVTRRGTSHRATVARKAPVDRKMSRRATVARHMSDIFRANITLRVKVATQTVTGKKMPGRPRIAWRKKSVGRRNRIAALIERATQRVWPLKKKFTNTAKLEIAKLTVRSTVERRLRKQWEACARAPTDVLHRIATNMEKDWTLWRGRPPPKRKKGNGPRGRKR
jgi:hypothetical protein